MAGTINLTDLYGTATPSRTNAQEPAVNAASGTGKDASPAFSWLGFLVLLVLLRLLYEYAG